MQVLLSRDRAYDLPEAAADARELQSVSEEGNRAAKTESTWLMHDPGTLWSSVAPADVGLDDGCSASFSTFSGVLLVPDTSFAACKRSWHP